MRYRYSNGIAFVVLCMSVQVHAMNGAHSLSSTVKDDRVLCMEKNRLHTEKEKQEFETYFQNGNPWADARQTTDEELAKVRAYIEEPYERVPVTKDGRDRLMLLKSGELPTQEVCGLHMAYNDCFHTFMQSCLYKQMLVRRIHQKDEKDDIKQLYRDLSKLECDIKQFTTGLTETRRSGLEHYIVLRYLLHYMRIPDEEQFLQALWDTPENRTSMWIQRPKEALAWAQLSRYIDPENKNAMWHHVSPMSMAIIRHQLYGGLEGLEYKKTTEYTGPAICRVKKEGEEPRYVSYETLEAALTLAEKQAAGEENGQHKKMKSENG